VTSLEEPHLLILETSGRIGQVALAQGENLLSSRRLEEARRHARDLVPAVADLLASAGWQPRDVHGVIVSHGPGSYTGLRVGIMSAKTFAYATGCKLLAVSTFAAIALQAPSDVQEVDVLADAQQDKIYVQRFTRPTTGADWVNQSPLSIQKLGDWLAQRENRVWISGPGLQVYRNRLPEGVQVVDAEHWNPQPESLLRIGLARYRAGEQDDVWMLEPLYLRASSAEERWQARSQT
jgi:tRNA threonylcarbamoyladenosine biosynthesis protein TsaB